MLRLRTLFSRGAGAEAYRCVVVFPKHTETRLLKRLPFPGGRIRDDRGSRWIVTEVLQSGRRTYTVFAGEMRHYRETFQRSGGGGDLAEDLLDLARHSVSAAVSTRRRWKNRHFLP